MQILRDLNLSLREQQPQSAILKRSTPKSSRGAPEQCFNSRQPVQRADSK